MPAVSAVPVLPVTLLSHRSTVLARAALVVCCLGWLWLGGQGGGPSAVDWACALAGLALGFAAGGYPLAVLVGQSLLLLVVEHAGETTPVTSKVLVALALLELAARRRGRPVLLGALAVLAAYAVIGAQRSDAEPAGMLYRTAVVVAIPLLLGAYLNAVRRLVAESRERAAEAEQRRQLTARAVRAAERAAISREVHDLVAHHLASMVLRLGVARHVVPAAGGPVAEVLEDVHETAVRAMDDLKRLVRMLRESHDTTGADSWPMDPAELLPALRAIVEHSGPAGLGVEARLDPAVREVDPLQALAVLRVVQEALTNVAKHAGPGTSVQVSVERGPLGSTVVRVTDDGGGARDESTGRTPPGHGLLGLRERMDLVGGTLHTGPAPEGGWRLTASLPPPRRPDATTAPAAPAARTKSPPPGEPQ